MKQSQYILITFKPLLNGMLTYTASVKME